ncbi:oxidoreductase domain protein [Magnetococcus marinus MC-1]|uniref:Oxidoreductase domain protein n=1 Tax=Magnetococcus marinus (strain ATCC BAA-1437 / JCM 17883 / MC-1) TaxID=156889 RepID=A0LAD1_MAGMM|nr:Gfo/Idh/MocA family oxidoreductase [Magnetococcus marinus]ABK44924.1 oxidoreductase domain protein [Magnetococcus marinus MC-1]
MFARLKFAIVGCGRIAQRHVEHIQKYGQLVAVCDVVQEKADALAHVSGAKAFYDLEQMFAQLPEAIDVVSICTPNGLHAAHTLRAFKAGCHVLCEKPMAISVADCGEMIKAGERASRRLFVVKQNRYNPPVVAIKKLLDEGALGRVYSVQLSCFWNRNAQYYEKDAWKGSRDLDGGCLYTQFSHFIDLLYWMVGDVKQAMALTHNFCHQDTVAFEDAGVVALAFHNGALGTVNFTINSYGKNMEGSLTLFCEKGSVKIGGQYLNELEYQNIEAHLIEDLPEGRPPNQYGHYVGSMSNHGAVYENLVSVLTGQGVIGTAGFEGLKTVEIIDKIYTAANRVSPL